MVRKYIINTGLLNCVEKKGKREEHEPLPTYGASKNLIGDVHTFINNLPESCMSTAPLAAYMADSCSSRTNPAEERYVAICSPPARHIMSLSALVTSLVLQTDLLLLFSV